MILVCSSKIGAPTPVGKVRPVFTVVPGAADADAPRRDGGASLIDEIVREGARRMLAEALQAEVDAYIARFVGERDENGRRLVVRNGSHQSREVLTSAGAVEVRAPRVNDRRVDPAPKTRPPTATTWTPKAPLTGRWAKSKTTPMKTPIPSIRPPPQHRALRRPAPHRGRCESVAPRRPRGGLGGTGSAQHRRLSRGWSWSLLGSPPAAVVVEGGSYRR